MENIFDIQALVSNKELSEIIIESDVVKIERIVSNGEISAENFWYNQAEDEWVCLLQGEATILFESNESIDMRKGDHILIPAHKKHRVSKVSREPNCIWLAIFLKRNSG